MSSVSKISIPNSAKKTIQNIKEIAGKHSEDEIYAMLKECSMDPNETAQKLLFQDTFHEVKRKRYKRRESNREVADIKWRSGSQGRGPRASRGCYNSSHASHDLGTGRNVGAVKENGIALGRDKEISSSLHTQKNSDLKVASRENIPLAFMSRYLGNMSNGLSKEEHSSADEVSLNVSSAIEGSASAIKNNGISSTQVQLLSTIGQDSSSVASAGVYASASDPVLLPSSDGRISASVSTVKHDVGVRQNLVGTNADNISSQNSNDSELSLSYEVGPDENSSPFLNVKAQQTSPEVEVAKLISSFQSAPSAANAGIYGSRPSNNYSYRPQHTNGRLKSASKEWKPKLTNVIQAPSSEVHTTSDIDLNKGEAGEVASPHASNSGAFDYTTNTLKLEVLQISDTQHVIIPDHLQVPESEMSGLSFGSFDSNFGFAMALKDEPENTNCLEETSMSSTVVEENFCQLTSSIGGESPVVQDNSFADDKQRSVPENNLSSVTDIPTSISTATEYEKSKPCMPFSTEGPHTSIIHAAPVHSTFGLVPQVLGSPFTAFEGADAQARDTSCLPSYVVPRPFDISTNYYASVYRPNTDGGRFSPFLVPRASPKYNGSVTILPSQSGQSLQEGSNSSVFSTGPTPLASQATGVLQTSVAAGQQPLPIFRHPAGVHMPHYPSNYIPYSQYLSPFYVPPPAAIHHFLGNASIFPLQLPTGALYPPPTATIGATKYPISQYKPSSNSGPTGQGTYAINPSGYNSTVSGTSSAGNDDLSSSHFKESNLFITGQKSEGSATWISPPGRNIPTLQANSFYSLPHGPPVAFTPTQAGHTTAFAGVYHPAQSVTTGPIHPLLQQSQSMGIASDIVAAPAGMYQLPQRSSQLNWVNNF